MGIIACDSKPCLFALLSGDGQKRFMVSQGTLNKPPSSVLGDLFSCRFIVFNVILMYLIIGNKWHKF